MQIELPDDVANVWASKDGVRLSLIQCLSG